MSGIKTARGRWRGAMPRFFKVIAVVCSLVSGTALAVNTAMTAAGAQPHEWWIDIYPYLVGIPAGMAFVSKFTVNGGFKDEKKET